MPHTAGNNVRLLTGNSHPALAKAVADRLGIALTPCNVSKFSARETGVQIHQSVRDEDCFILQSPSPPSINDHLMELLILISACKTASAKRITAVIPCFPYARQDKKDKARAPITAKLVANLLAVAGADHVITMDLHASQIQGFFDIPCDNLFTELAMVGYIKAEVPGWKEGIIVSPDAGGAKRATALADRLNLDFALINRKRKRGHKNHVPSSLSTQFNMSSANTPVPGTPTAESENGRSIFSGGGGMSNSFHMSMTNSSVSIADSLAGGADGDDEKPDKMELLVGDVKGKIAILVDDMIDTGHTVRLAAEVLREAGAKEIYVLISHGLLSDVTMKALKNLPITKLVLTNTIDQTARIEESNGMIETIDIAPLIAESIRRTHNGESISALFRSDPF
ncbi:ribose phosphate diphosphokinase subunit prs4 [Naganishia albida]|nr:ribose phosphate diphosphokinase subunit prs4 [Naganishia albida]